jgi:hypothetical protein
MASQDGRRQALRIIVSILIGLAVVAVVGVGLRTFYPPPSQSESELKKLDEQQKALDASRAFAGSMSRSHEALYRKVTDEIAAKKSALVTGREAWLRNTSIILVVVAAVAMGASLVLARRFRVVSNGLLLGGCLIMLYAVAWSFTKGDPNTRYAVLTVAVLVTVAVGYLRFVRVRTFDRARLASVEPTPPAG